MTEAVNHKPVNARISPTMAVGCVTGVIAIAFPAFAAYGYAQHGVIGVLAAGVAGGICWAAGSIAILFVTLLRDPDQVISAIGLAMMFRMGIPLVAGIFLMKLGGPLAEAGVFGMIVGFYLIGLVVETFLAVRLTSNSNDD